MTASGRPGGRGTGSPPFDNPWCDWRNFGSISRTNRQPLLKGRNDGSLYL